MATPTASIRVSRDMVIFSEQNMVRDPPFSRLDLISCRNLLIYLRPAGSEGRPPLPLRFESAWCAFPGRLRERG